MYESGKLFKKSDPLRFLWFGRAAALGEADAFLTQMEESVREFNSGNGYANVVFAIGRALKGHIDNELQTIFVKYCNFKVNIGPANQALSFYNFQLQSYRKAIDTWTLVALRNNVVKDIRKMIGMMIWDLRDEAKYEKEEEEEEVQ